MSRLRKELRDMNRQEQRADPTAATPQREYTFHLQTPHGVRTVTVPDRHMKACPCGCDLFKILYRCAFVRPSGIVGAEPVRLLQEAVVCESCGRELRPDDATKGEREAMGNGAAAKLIV